MITGQCGTAVGTLPNAQANRLSFVPAEGQNQTVQEPASQNQTIQESDESYMHPQNVSLVSHQPDPSVQNVQVLLLPPHAPQQLELVITAPSPSRSHLQLVQGSNNLTAPTQPTSARGPDSPLLRKRGRPRKAVPSPAQLVFWGSDKYRRILPKPLQPAACVASTATTSGLNASSLPTNPLDAAKQCVFPEFAAQGFPGRGESQQSGEMETDQAAGVDWVALDQPATVATSPPAGTYVQPASAANRAQLKRKKTGKCKDRIKSVTASDAGIESEGGTRISRGEQTDLDGDCGNCLPDLASPQPLFIDDGTPLSGANTSPSMTRAKGKRRRLRDKPKVKECKVTREGQAPNSYSRKPKSSVQKELPTDAAAEMSARSVPGGGERTQAKVHDPSSPAQQALTTTAQGLVRDMMNPMVPYAVSVRESENEVSLSDHDGLTALIPVSMLPPVSSQTLNEAGSFLTLSNSSGLHQYYPASTVDDAPPGLTTLQAPADRLSSGQDKSPAVPATSGIDADGASCAAASHPAPAQREAGGSPPAQSSQRAPGPAPTPAKSAACGLASEEQHPASLDNAGHAHPPALLPSVQGPPQGGRADLGHLVINSTMFLCLQDINRLCKIGIDNYLSKKVHKE